MTRKILLERRMTLDAAAALWDEIQALKGKPISVDCSEVRHFSGAAFQVLLSARRLCRAAGQPFEISAPSEAFETTLGLLGRDALISGDSA